MKTFELIMETVLRKTFIRVLHVAWLATYAAIFLIPFPPELWNWGAFVFGWSGCLLPVLLSAGIVGDDIASGRISLLITKPLRLGDLYLYRLFGLSFQGTVHIAVAGALIFGLHRLTNRGSIEYFAVWLLASWLIFNTWAALSTTLSVVVKRERNAMLLFFGTGIIYFAVGALMHFFPDSRGTALFHGVVRWAYPPVEFLSELGMAKHTFGRSVGDVGHALVLTALYGALGMFLLGRREYKRTGD